MSRVEDVLRETMLARDVDAPTAAGFRFRRPVAARRHRFRWVPAVAVAAGVTVMIGIVVAVVPHAPSRHTTAALTAAVLACPATSPTNTSPRDLYPLPPRRANALTVSDRLVPATTPVHAVVCAYLHPDAGRLTGSRVVDRGLATLPGMLAWLPPQNAAAQGCTLDIRPTDGDSYLIGLSYPSGTMWVSAPGNHCLGSSNGRFVTSTHVATETISAYRTGRWTPPAPTVMNGCPMSPGRLGQEHALVPATPVSVVICHGLLTEQITASKSRTGTKADLEGLVAALNALPTEPDRPMSMAYCREPAQLAYYYADFLYRVGPPVTVTIAPSCRPAIHNGNLQANDATSVVPIVQRILTR